MNNGEVRDANRGAKGVPVGTLFGVPVNPQDAQPIAVSGSHNYVDPFADDTPIVCDATEPETCEACD